MAKVYCEQLSGGGALLKTTARPGRGRYALIVIGSIVTGLAMYALLALAVGVAGVCCMSIGVAIGLTLLLWAWWQFKAAVTGRRLAQPTLRLPHHPLNLGDALDIAYAQEVREPCAIDGVRLTVIGEERVRFRSGKSHAERTHKAVEQHIDVLGAGDVFPGPPLTGNARVLIPPDALHTFDAENNHFEWRFELEVRVPGLPAYAATFPFEVAPRLAAGADLASRAHPASGNANDTERQGEGSVTD